MARHLEISAATYHRWRAQFGGMKADNAKRLKELEGERAGTPIMWALDCQLDVTASGRTIKIPVGGADA